MKQLTKLWLTIHDSLTDIGNSDEFTKELYSKFDEIFDRKEVIEYKAAALSDILSPSQFLTTTNAMKRALVEGYLLAQLEQRKENTKQLYKTYREDLKEKNNEKVYSIDGNAVKYDITISN